VKRPALADVDERTFAAQVTDLARLLSWRRYHTYRSTRSEPGWPDEALLRERLILLELKTEKGKLSDAQRSWLTDLLAAGVEAYVARPSDLDTLAAILKHRGSPLTVPGCEKAYETLRQRTQEALEPPKPRLLGRPATPASDQLTIPPEDLEPWDTFMSRTAAKGGQER
jgi:hypothetical protein